MPHACPDQLSERVFNHLSAIYTENDNTLLTERLIKLMRLDEFCYIPEQQNNCWDEHDVAVITYGNSITFEDKSPLKTLFHFLHQYLSDTINTVHILPFFPYCADDGFSVINYKEVNPEVGSWDDIDVISREFRLMSDLVICLLYTSDAADD